MRRFDEGTIPGHFGRTMTENLYSKKPNIARVCVLFTLSKFFPPPRQRSPGKKRATLK